TRSEAASWSRSPAQNMGSASEYALRAINCPVMVVPTLAPSTMAKAWGRPRTPAPTRATVTELTALELCTIAVTRKPHSTPFQGRPTARRSHGPTTGSQWASVALKVHRAQKKIKRAHTTPTIGNVKREQPPSLQITERKGLV